MVLTICVANEKSVSILGLPRVGLDQAVMPAQFPATVCSVRREDSLLVQGYILAHEVFHGS